MSIFYPEISQISLRNYEIIEDPFMVKRVRGDIYWKDQCVGMYDPCQIKDNSSGPIMMLRIEDEYQELWDMFIKYSSLFEYGVSIDEETQVNKVGLGVLMNDLELLTIMYSFWSAFPEDENLIGIINGDTFKAIKINNMTVSQGRRSIIQYIKNNVFQIKIDDEYPTVIFCKEEDFIFNPIIYVEDDIE